LKTWVEFAKRVRPLVHTGELVRADRPSEPETALYGVVAPDRREALSNFVRLQTGPRYNSAPIVFPGLEPALRYRVERVHLPGEGPAVHGPNQHTPPDVVVAPGVLLGRAGIEAPSTRPEQAIIYHLQALS
jgi:alpha-galactosidase